MKKKLLILFLFLSMFMVVGCKKKEEVKPKVENEIRDLTDVEIEELMARIGGLHYFDINPAKSFKTSELTNQEVLLWAFEQKKSYDEIKFEDLEKLASKYLDYSLEPENILCMTHFNILGPSDYSYLYIPASKTFEKNKNHTAHKITGYYSWVIDSYRESKYENGNYIIKVSKLFSDTSNTGGIENYTKYDWFKSYNDAKNNTNPIVKNETAYKVKADNSKLNTYTYTFVLKNGNYVLKSYVIEQ